MNRLRPFLLLLFCGLINISFSQITDKEKDLKAERKDSIDGWKTGGLTALNLSQVGLMNWVAGGQSSIAVNGIVSLFADWKKENSTWDNSIDLGYGILYQGDNVMLSNGRLLKTDDKIDVFSKYGKRASKKWYYASLLNFTTQSTAGYNYPNDSIEISGFMAPAYLLGAIGMDYKPVAQFTAFIAPLTLKMTLVNNQSMADSGFFGVDPAEYDQFNDLIHPGKKFRMEYGGYVRMKYSGELMKNIKLTSKLGLFSNYADKPQNIDVNWENLLELKVNKWISATVATHLIYDDDIDIAYDSNGDGTLDGKGPRTQFKEVIGVGFSYKFE